MGQAPWWRGTLGEWFVVAQVAHAWATLGYAILLLVFVDLKSRREERWLMAKFPGYTAYRRRVRRLIPYVY
jgi:protein-S-isoprenylcysteine O-methyltransferase Ste14